MWFKELSERGNRRGAGAREKGEGAGRKGGGGRRIFRALSEAGVIEDFVWRL